jgi:hypothetical protein
MSDLTIPETPGEGPVEAPTEVSSELSAEASAELDVYSDALKRCQLLMTEGRHEEALAELNRLQAPSTEAGKEIWPLVQLVKRIPRAMLYTLSDAEPEALAEWQAIRAEAPSDPQWDEFRWMADGWILVQERGTDNLTEDEYRSLHPSAQMFVNQQRALRTAIPAFKSAVEAVTRGDEAEYANQMAIGRRAVARAAAENPAVKPAIEAIFDLVELLILTMRQQREFDWFNFDRVSSFVAPLETSSKQVASSEAATKPQVMPMAWIVDLASFVTSLGRVTERLSRLLHNLLSQGGTAKHLEELSKIEDEIRKQQQIIGEIKAPAFIDTWRKLLLDVAEKLLRLSERLSVEVRPSRRKLLNVAGLASTIAFVTVAALLLVLGRLTGGELNGGVVLALSAFFGLVAGFGYGALRFRGFLTSVLFARGQEGGTEGSGS